MKLKYLFTILGAILFLGACGDDKIGSSIIEDPEISTLPTDRYIYNNLVIPYNVDVKYRWDHSETELSKNLVPPKEDYVVPFLEAVIQGWINPYVEIDKKSKGMFIFPQYMPKMLLLVGSPGYNNDNTVTQGTAEGGRKIVLYEINRYGSKNLSTLQRYFHVMHHEFGHILHQTAEFSTEYQLISAGSYMSTWYRYSDAYANQHGFITAYAMLEYHEDFVEMVASMLTRTRAQWDALLARMPESGKPKLLEKEKMVITYFKYKWNIDVFELQAIIQEKLNQYMGNGQNLRSESDNNLLLPYFSYEENNVCQYCRQHRQLISKDNP